MPKAILHYQQEVRGHDLATGSALAKIAKITARPPRPDLQFECKNFEMATKNVASAAGSASLSVCPCFSPQIRYQIIPVLLLGKANIGHFVVWKISARAFKKCGHCFVRPNNVTRCHCF